MLERDHIMALLKSWYMSFSLTRHVDGNLNGLTIPHMSQGLWCDLVSVLMSSSWSAMSVFMVLANIPPMSTTKRTGGPS